MPSCVPFEDTTTTIGIEGVNGEDEWEECKRHYLLFYCCTRIIISELDATQRQNWMSGSKLKSVSVIILLLYV